jgi:hypothetical protein
MQRKTTIRIASIYVSSTLDEQAHNVDLVSRNRKVSQTHSKSATGAHALLKISAGVDQLGIVVKNPANCRQISVAQ